MPPKSRWLVLAGVVGAAALLAGVSSAGGSSRAVVIREADGDLLAREPLPASGRFALAYRHSYYQAPAREVFRAGPPGFELRELVSSKAAVLDYYAVAGRRTRAPGRVRLELDDPPRYRRLSLIATATGRRTLVVGDRRVPLYRGHARHLTLTVEDGS